MKILSIAVLACLAFAIDAQAGHGRRNSGGGCSSGSCSSMQAPRMMLMPKEEMAVTRESKTVTVVETKSSGSYTSAPVRTRRGLFGRMRY